VEDHRLFLVYSVYENLLISQKAGIIYKKMIILLAAVGGSGSYAIRQEGIIQMVLFFVFVFFSVGVVINYFELNKMKQELEEIENG